MQADVTHSKISEGIEIIFTIFKKGASDKNVSIYVYVCRGGVRVCANIQLMTWDNNPEITTD